MARINKHSKDPKFVKLGEKLEELRLRHEQGLVNSIEFLKMLLNLAREAAAAEKEVVPEEEIDKGKAALTELFEGVRNENTPIIVKRDTSTGRQDVKKALRQTVWIKYKIHDKELFDKAYGYVEQYY